MRLIISIILLLLFTLANEQGYARDPIKDSLLNLYNQSANDTLRIVLLNEITDHLRNEKPEEALEFSEKALVLAEKEQTKNEEGSFTWKRIQDMLASAYNYKGLIFEDLGKHEKAMSYYNQALDIFKAIGDQKGVSYQYNNIANVYHQKGDNKRALKFHFKSLEIKKTLTGVENEIAGSYMNIGSAYEALGEYAKAVDYYFKALRMKEEVKDEKGIAGCYNNIGMVSWKQDDLDRALKYYSKSLEIMKKIESTGGMIMGYNNIGLIYEGKEDYDNALENYMLCLELVKKIQHQPTLAIIYNNIGNIYKVKEDYKNALKYLNQSREIKEELGLKSGLPSSYINIGSTYELMGKYQNAIRQYKRALEIAEEIDDKSNMSSACNGLATIYAKTRQFKKAYEYKNRHSALRDTLLNEAKNRQITEMEAKYESEKKDKEIKLKTALIEKKEAEAKKKEAELTNSRYRMYGMAAGSLVLLFFLGFVWRLSQMRKKANLLLKKQKEEISQQRDMISEQKEKITDSIEYAKTIQQAVLPGIAAIEEALPGCFIYFQPRDIVSGDFYFFHREQERVYLSAADCTGHGIPGAFVSMLCSNLMNQCIAEKKLTSPGDILSKVNEGVLEGFQKEKKTQVRDGMDLVLACFDKDFRQVEFAAAMNPLVIIRNGEVIEIEGDRTMVGGQTESSFQFKTQKARLQQNDWVYMFSDGYPDQFGGEKGKKFMKKKFYRLLGEISTLSPGEQKEKLHETLLSWQGDFDRVDDICVIGLRVQ